MKNLTRIAALTALLIPAFLSPPVGAQVTVPSKSGAAVSNTAPTTKYAEKREDLVEKRINDLHTQLKITPQQAKQWNAFALTMRDNAQAMGHAFHERIMKLPSMNAEQAMKSYAAITQLNAENMQKLSASFSDLYGVLTKSQKAVADKLFRNERRRLQKASQKRKQ